MACDIIIKKLNNIVTQCDESNIPLIKTATAVENCVDVKLINENYTIGKVLEYIDSLLRKKRNLLIIIFMHL